MFRFFSNNSQKNVKYNFISYFNIILFIFDIFLRIICEIYHFEKIKYKF